MYCTVFTSVKSTVHGNSIITDVVYLLYSIYVTTYSKKIMYCYLLYSIYVVNNVQYLRQ